MQRIPATSPPGAWQRGTAAALQRPGEHREGDFTSGLLARHDAMLDHHDKVLGDHKGSIHHHEAMLADHEDRLDALEAATGTAPPVPDY